MLEINFDTNAPIAGGYYFDMTQEDYRKHADYLSASDLKKLAINPREYFCEQPHNKTDAMIEGTLLHILLNEPHNLSDYFEITHADRITATMKKEAGVKDLIKAQDFDRVSACVEFIKKELLNAGLDLDTFKGEVSYFGEYDYKGQKIKGKCRFDKLDLENKISIDIKKTQDASCAKFFNQCASLNYPMQAYWYEALTGIKFFWLAIETIPVFNRRRGREEFNFMLVESTPAINEKAKELVERAIERYLKADIYDSPISASLNPEEDAEGIALVKSLVLPNYYFYQ